MRLFWLLLNLSCETYIPDDGSFDTVHHGQAGSVIETKIADRFRVSLQELARSMEVVVLAVLSLPM